MPTQILDHQDILYRTKRIAFQAAEAFAAEQEIILAGISNSGYLFAQMLDKELSDICDLKISLCEVRMDKKKPLETIESSISPDLFEGKNIILCDDVLNSGTTLIYGVRYFLQVPLKKFKTAVLIDRNHKKYPVKADFKGISLSTNLQEHIIVDLDGEYYSASLS